jgi:uncharacterized protein (TIGR02145 family)
MGMILLLSSSCKKNDDTSPVTDIDGNSYKIVKIGSQVWMAENLRTTRYNNGASIPQVTDSAAWSRLTTPGYCFYENNPVAFQSAFGALYNWYALNTGDLAPDGWHVATDDDWNTLMKELGESLVAGGKMKTTGYYGSANGLWLPFNTGATNESGFSGNPGGERKSDGAFSGLFYSALFWSTSGDGTEKAWYSALSYMKESVYRNSIEKSSGFSVRCVRND